LAQNQELKETILATIPMEIMCASTRVYRMVVFTYGCITS